MQSHAPRQLRVWLIYNVRQKMKPLVLEVLPSAEFWRVYQDEGFVPPEKAPDYTVGEYEADKAFVEKELSVELSKHWKRDRDFVVAFDKNYALHSCGGAYSSALVCRRYAEIVWAVLSKLKKKDLWVYHTALELDESLDGQEPFTGFFIRNGVMYAPAGDLDWSKYFEKK